MVWTRVSMAAGFVGTATACSTVLGIGDVTVRDGGSSGISTEGADSSSLAGDSSSMTADGGYSDVASADALPEASVDAGSPGDSPTGVDTAVDSPSDSTTATSSADASSVDASSVSDARTPDASHVDAQAMDANSHQPAEAATGGCTDANACQLVVEEASNDTSALGVQTNIYLVNPNLNSTVPLAGAKLRYYFGNTQYGGSLALDVYAVMNSSGTVSGTDPFGCTLTTATTTASATGAANYFEIDLSSTLPSVPVADGYVELQIGVHTSDYTDVFTSYTTDYSYQASSTTVTANPHITLYIGDTLVWGVEPQ